MKKNSGYKGIDGFRLIAAVLVIAIHTSPLEFFNPAADFILTRVAARVAVPFFLMTSGFFLLGDNCAEWGRLKKFLKKTLLIYGVSIVLYLPLNVYGSYFSGDGVFWKILKDLIFDGTFYHLWYLPASALGGVLAFAGIRALGYRKTLIVFSVLYGIGLLGDSYYGVSEGIPMLEGMFEGIFKISEYTRNGVFFAPLFMLLGGITKELSSGNGEHAEVKGKSAVPLRLCAAGSAAAFGLMLGEALLLRKLGLQRHDSMYIFLVPLMMFLFNGLIGFRGKRNKYVSELALAVYILHPWVIVAVRGAAKAVKAESLLIENGIGHFAAVTLLSFVAAITVIKLKKTLSVKRKH